MTSVLVVSQHADTYRKLLEMTPLPGAEIAYAGSADAALSQAATAEVLFGAPDMLALLLEHCASLRWVQSSWAGVTPLLNAARRDYLLTGVKDIFGQPMAEFTLGWLLALERNIPARFEATHWNDRADGGVAGKTIGIMGTGSIGAAVAQACTALGLAARGLNSNGRSVEGFEQCWPMADRLAFADGLEYLLAVLPDTPGTDAVVDEALLSALAPGAIFINGGRGNAVVMPDLLAALERGQLRHAVLDVLPEEPLPDGDPLWQVEGLSITSHTAAPTPAVKIVEVFRENYLRYQAGEPLSHRIDFERGY